MRGFRSSSGSHRFNSLSRRSTGNSVSLDSEIKDIVSSPENNNRCGECNNSFPTWCSVNLGCMLCGRCASVHRKILNTRNDAVFSEVKSLSMDRWSGRDIDTLTKLGGNKGNKKFWNPKNEPFPFDGDDDKTQVECFIRDKYVNGKFRYDEVRPEDFGDESEIDIDSRSDARRDRFDGFDASQEGGRTRSNSSSRRSRSNGNTHYERELRQMLDMGFNDDSQTRWAIQKAHGDVNRAITYLDRNDSLKPVGQKNTSPIPNLPQRPAVSGPQPAIFDGMSNTSILTPPASSASFVSQQPAAGIQQYIDPNTGVVYVDQGQYLQAMQVAQQQQALAQQQAIVQQQIMMQQQQQQHQMNKNAIMGLYQRPDLYSSPVEITPSNPQYQQLLQQQQQQQQQQQHFSYQ